MHVNRLTKKNHVYSHTKCFLLVSHPSHLSSIQPKLHGTQISNFMFKLSFSTSLFLYTATFLMISQDPQSAGLFIQTFFHLKLPRLSTSSDRRSAKVFYLLLYSIGLRTFLLSNLTKFQILIIYVILC